MPIPIGNTQGARNAVISKVIAELETDAEKVVAISEIDARLSDMSTPIETPRVVEDGWIRTEDIHDIVSAVETNLLYLATMADLQRAVAKTVSILIDGRSKATTAAANEATSYVNNLRLYLSARKGGGDSIVISPGDVTGSYSAVGNTFGCAISSSLSSSVTIKDVVTNGFKGNMLELIADTQTGTKLSDVTFLDPGNELGDSSKATDGDIDTKFEIEAMRVLAGDFIEHEIKAWKDGKRVNLNWNAAPSGGKLVAELTAKISTGRITSIRIIPDLALTEKVIIEDIEYSRDNGQTWTKARGPKAIGRMTGAYESGSAAGEGTWHIPGGRANLLKIRLVQDTPYRTKLATVDYIVKGTNGPLVAGPAFSTGDQKTGQYVPDSTVYHGSRTLEKSIIARPADRWCISIKDIDARADEYERTSTFQTKTYDLPATCERLVISCDELVPAGCSATYEISHDGVTWTEVNPIQRTSGREVVIFSSGGESDPNTEPGAIFVETDGEVKELTLRVTLTSRGSDSATVMNMSIHPILKR